MPFEYYLNVIVPFIAMAVGISGYKSFGKGFKILFYFVCFAACTELVMLFVVSVKHINTMPAAHVYVPIEFIMLILFYANYVEKYIKKKYIYSIIFAFVVFSVLNALYLQKVAEYPNIVRALESIILVLFSILYFHKVLVEAKITKLSKEPMIWVNTIILVYFSSNFFFHILLPILVLYSVDFAFHTVYFFWTTNIMFYLVLTVGFYKQKKLAEL